MIPTDLKMFKDLKIFKEKRPRMGNERIEIDASH